MATNSESEAKKLVKMKKRKGISEHEDLVKMSQEELIAKILQLEAYNKQLKDILFKKTSEDVLKKTPKSKKSNKKFDFSKVSKRHVLLKFYYLGWDYHGYVTQENTCKTIEFYLFQALEQTCLIESRETSNYHRCGRTDKGVSSFGQVISIDLRSKLDEPSENNTGEELPYCKMLNRLLPKEIQCYAWTHVGSEISARFDCTSRKYKYFFPVGNVKIYEMEKAAKDLIGYHDYRNFCKMDVGNCVTDFRRAIKSVDIDLCSSATSELSEEYQIAVLTIEGSGFLWHQIRCIMSVLFLVGQGKESPDVVKELLDVEKHPRKPQYSLANEVPLNLFKADFGSLQLNWNVDEIELMEILKCLQSEWTGNAVKTAMIREMISELETMRTNSTKVTHQIESLLDGVKPKVYTPLLERKTCESLEKKIEHYVKRRKLTIENNEPT